MSAVIEKYSTLLPRNGQGKRIIKAKLLTALGATGVLLPFPQNPEHIIERKILLQTPFTATGQGGAPVAGNGLLKSLSTYWKMDENVTGGTRFDASGNNRNLTDNNTNESAINPGKINLGVNCNALNASNGLFSTDAAFDIGAGVSFTITFWLQNAGLVNNVIILGMDDLGSNRCYEVYLATADSTLHWALWNLSSVLTDTSTGIARGTIAVAPNFDFMVVGYDDSVQQAFWQYNNGARSTFAMAGVKGGVAGTTKFCLGSTNLGTANQVAFDEVGFWRRALSVSDVNTLYNSGNALPFSSFTF